MNIKPSENTKLFGMNHYFSEITKLYNEQKMPNKILFSGKKGLGKSTLAYHIVNFILSQIDDYKYDIDQFKINKESNKVFSYIYI